MAASETARLIAELTLRDKMSAGLKSAQASLTSLEGSFGRVGTGVGQVAGGLVRLGVVATAAAVGGLVSMAKAGADFEAQLRVINTIAQQTEPALADIGAGIRELAASTGADLADLTAGYYDLLSAGIKVGDAQAILAQSYKLGRGALGTTAQGVDVLTTAINSYSTSTLYAGKSTSELAVLFSDQLAQAVNDGKLKLDDIASTFADIAPLAAQSGIGLDQIAAAYGVITAKGSEASEVTTQMNRAILELLKPSADLEKLQTKLGKSYIKLAADIGLVPALQQLRKDAEAADVPFEQLFGRLEGLKFVLQSTGVNFDNFGTELDRIRNSAGRLDLQVSARNKGLAFSVGVLGANFKEAQLLMSTGFTPALERMADRVTKFLQENKDEFISFGKDIGKALDSIDLDALLAAVKSFGSTFKNDVLPVLRTALDLFRSLPGPVQGLTAAFAIGANTPLVGGAISQIGKGIANVFLGSVGIGLKALTGILGSAGGGAAGGVLGGVSKLLAQPVFVTNWPLGGLGGAAGGAGAAGAAGVAGRGAGLLNVLSKVFVVGIAAEAASLLSGPIVELGKFIGQNRPEALTSFGEAWEAWRRNADWPFGQKNAPEWAGGTPSPGKVVGGGLAAGVPSATGGLSPDDRSEAYIAKSIAALVAAFGTHEAAVATFGAAELKAFRTTAEGAIDLFDERIKYLAGAEGSGAGSEKYLGLIQRDIDALKTILPTASAADAATITSQIAILQGILDAKKFETSPELLDAVTSSSDKTNQHLEDNRVEASRTAADLGLKLQRIGEIGAGEAANVATQTAAVDRTNQRLEDNRAATVTASRETVSAVERLASSVGESRTAVVGAIAREEATLGYRLQRLGETGAEQTAATRAQVSAVDRMYDRLEANRAATVQSGRETTSAIELLAQQRQKPPVVNVSVSTQVTIRDIARTTAISSRLGFVAS